MSRPCILVVDDDEVVRLMLDRHFSPRGAEVVFATTLASATEALEARVPDLGILDYELPDGTALDLLALRETKALDFPVVILTGHGSIDLAVRTVRAGAENFLTKPLDFEALDVIVERLIDIGRHRRAQQVRKPAIPDPFVGGSPAIRRLEEDARKIVDARAPILIEGETGTGKGVLARWLHENGPRADEPFVDINCAGLSDELLQSELFGHQKGAFTGASSEKKGLVEVADRGTLFLDEIGDLSFPVQPQLLKVLEENRFRRVGSVVDRKVNLRLLSATHQDLARQASSGKFRQDLFFRLSTIRLRVPSLRERRDDIRPLAQRFFDEIATELGRRESGLSEEALDALERYGWPGNIRELRNVLEYAILLGGGEGSVRAADLRLLEGQARTPTDESLTLEEVEIRHIERVLKRERGHVPTAARRLGISRSSLYDKIKRFELNQPA